MARFFIPDLGYRPKAGKDIKKDVLSDLNTFLLEDALVCIGMTAGHREVDLVIFKNGFVHVVESKDKYLNPVKFFKNKGLLLQKPDGDWEPIVNDRNSGEYANVQAEKCARAVAYGFSKTGINIKTSPYILVPHPYPGSDVSENADYIWIAMSVNELVTSLQIREEQLLKRGQVHQYSKSDLVNVFESQFDLHETNVIQGYRIGDPVPPFDRNNPYGKDNCTVNEGFYSAGKLLHSVIKNIENSNPSSFSPLLKKIIKTLYRSGVPLVRIGIIGFLSLVILSIFFHISVYQNMKVPRWGVAIIGLFLIFVSRVIFIFGNENVSPINIPEKKEPSPDSSTVHSKTNEVECGGMKQNETADLSVGIDQTVSLCSAELPQNSENKSFERSSSPFTRSMSHLIKTDYKTLYGILVILVFLGFVIFGAGSQRGCSKVDRLNIRSEPNGEVVGVFAKGACFYVSAISKDRAWVRIAGISNYGDWVSIRYVDGIDKENLNLAN